MSDKLTELAAKIAGKQARVGVIGLGYVGLPLALLFEERGFPCGLRHRPEEASARSRAASPTSATSARSAWPRPSTRAVRGDHGLRRGWPSATRS